MQRYTTDQKSNVIELYKAGVSRAEIVEKTGVARKSVEHEITKFRKLGVDLPAPRKRAKPRGGKADHKAIAALYEAGFNPDKIAVTLNISYSTVRDHVVKFRAENPDFKTPQVLARLERDKHICELRNNGKTYAAIAKEVGLSDMGVYQVCSKYGITAPAKRARKNNGEIPQEILAPLLEYMRKFISAEFAEKVQELARQIA